MNDQSSLLGMHSARPRGEAARLLGHRLLSVEEAPLPRVEAEFTATGDFCNPLGVIQGGILMAMLDQALIDACTVATRLERAAMTLEMQCNFLRPAFPGRLTCSATVLQAGRTTAFAEARLSDPEGRLLATASAVAALQEKTG